MFYSTHYSSPVGVITLAGNDDHLVGLWIEGQKYFGATIAEDLKEKSDLPVLVAAKKWLDKYFSDKKPAISDLPLAPIGGDFRKAIWKILCDIPYGECIAYGEIAKKMAVLMGRQSMSSQAVGGAVGHNPISIIIPCHRVVGSNGSLTGFAGGIDKKIKLLEHEGVDISKFFVPSKGSAL